MNGLDDGIPDKTQSYCYKSGHYTGDEMESQKSHHTYLQKTESIRIKYKWKILPGPCQKFSGSQT